MGGGNRLAGFTQGFNVQSDAFSNELQHLAPRLRHGRRSPADLNVCAVAGLALFYNTKYSTPPPPNERLSLTA